MGWTIMRSRAASLQMAAEAGHQIMAPEKKSSDWKLIDSDTGQVVGSETAVGSGVAVTPSGVQMWVPAQNIISKKPWLTVPLPEKIVVGLLLAMLGHATWNGSGILLLMIANDIGMSDLTHFLLDILLIIVLVIAVLLIGSGLLHSVRAAPDGSEVDDYQAQLATMTQQRF